MNTLLDSISSRLSGIPEDLHSRSSFLRDYPALPPAKFGAFRRAANRDRESNIFPDLNIKPGFELAEVNLSVNQIFVLNVNAGKPRGQMGPTDRESVPMPRETCRR